MRMALRLPPSPFYLKGEGNGVGMATSPFSLEWNGDGMATSQFHLKKKDDGMITSSPFYLNRNGDGMAAFLIYHIASILY